LLFCFPLCNSQKAKIYADWNRRSHTDTQINSSDGGIIVSYFLPVLLSRDTRGRWKAEWDKENLLSLQLNARTCWVGSVRYQNAPIPPEEEENVSFALAELNCHAVYISQNMHFQFYDIYCKQQLWPVMHHIADVYGPLNLHDISAKAQQNLWFVYSTVHKMFREKVLELYQANDLVWIHGFHLLLLPSFIRRRIPSAKIGYFFHTPFPSSEIWRTISRREELLLGKLLLLVFVFSHFATVCHYMCTRHTQTMTLYIPPFPFTFNIGILGADQIGFHLYEYARHFLTNCQRLMGCG